MIHVTYEFKDKGRKLCEMTEETFKAIRPSLIKDICISNDMFDKLLYGGAEIVYKVSSNLTIYVQKVDE